MVRRLKEEGAEVIVKGDVWDVADEYARQLAERVGGVHVSPFDDPLLWDGHASVIDEIKRDMDGVKPDAIVVSVGGGGLFLGVAEGLRRNGWDDVPIITAETDGADSFAAMAKKGEVVQLPEITSIAKSLGALAVSQKCVEWIRGGKKVIPVVVSDRDAVEACSLLAVQHRVLVEPACGAAVAAVQKTSAVGENVVVIVCGGNMASPALLEQWIKATGAKEAVL